MPPLSRTPQKWAILEPEDVPTWVDGVRPLPPGFSTSIAVFRTARHYPHFLASPHLTPYFKALVSAADSTVRAESDPRMLTLLDLVPGYLRHLDRYPEFQDVLHRLFRSRAYQLLTELPSQVRSGPRASSPYLAALATFQGERAQGVPRRDAILFVAEGFHVAAATVEAWITRGRREQGEAAAVLGEFESAVEAAAPGDIVVLGAKLRDDLAALGLDHLCIDSACDVRRAPHAHCARCPRPIPAAELSFDLRGDAGPLCREHRPSLTDRPWSEEDRTTYEDELTSHFAYARAAHLANRKPPG